LGAKTQMAPSGSHASVQKRVETPSLISTMTDELNMEETLRSGADVSSA
jgi:hypothetical protein